MEKMMLMNKVISLADSTVLYDTTFTAESVASDWLVRAGEWWVEDGWLTGRNPLNAPGMITCRKQFFGNVMLEFTAQTVLPSSHDIDCMWNGSWDDERNERGIAYVMGLQGWWEGKVGFEKSPECRLCATTPLFPFEPGRPYHIRAGSIDGHAFVFVDGQLLLEIMDPDPIDAKSFGMVGFEAYASHIRINHLKVIRMCWSPRLSTYMPEF